MAERHRGAVMVEEYFERHVEGPGGHVVERAFRRSHWAGTDGPTTAAQVVATAAPLLRTVALALAPVVAPVLGRLAVRALAPRLRAALPAPRVRTIVAPHRTPPLSLPPAPRDGRTPPSE